MLIPFRSNYALVSMILLIKHHCYILNPLSYMHPSIKLHKDKLRTTAGDRGGAGLLSELSELSESPETKQEPGLEPGPGLEEFLQFRQF